MLGTFRIRTEVCTGHSMLMGHGTAFAVELSEFGLAKPRYLLTACHVIREHDGSICPTIKIEMRAGCQACWASCRVMSYDVNMDVALLECASDLPLTSRLASSDAASGDKIVMIGSPEGIPLHAYKGTVLRQSGLELSSARVEFFKQGCSGGPVFDANSQELVGLAVAGLGKGSGMDPHTCLFVSLTNVKRFLTASLVRYRPQYARPAPPIVRSAPPIERLQPRRELAAVSFENKLDGDAEIDASRVAWYRGYGH